MQCAHFLDTKRAIHRDETQTTGRHLASAARGAMVVSYFKKRPARHMHFQLTYERQVAILRERLAGNGLRLLRKAASTA